MKTIIEPFRTKMVEPISFTSVEEREQILADADYNLFQVKAEDVIIDLLTDSGTAAMSSEQWSALMRADESYAGGASIFRLKNQVQQIFGFREVIPVHQGRAAERLMFSRLLKSGDIVPSNTHFDTTRANIQATGAEALDLPVVEGNDAQPSCLFNGNIDLASVVSLLAEHRERVPFAMLTISNNACAGQPVSLANIAGYSQILKKHGIKLYIDAARFAENAYMIKEREPEQAGKSVSAIVRDIFRYADGCLVSAKKDGLVNMGGFIALDDCDLAMILRQDLILTEGFPTHGGLSARDLEAMSVGLEEALSEDYLKYRRSSANYLAEGLRAAGIPVFMPPGLHAVYIDATAMLPHIAPQQLPGQSLVCALYLEAGIRSCEIGAVMFGQVSSESPRANKPDLVRLALPRRVYSQSHYDYVIEAMGNVYKKRNEVRGMRITDEPSTLRHFTAKFAPVEPGFRNVAFTSPAEPRNESAAVCGLK